MSNPTSDRPPRGGAVTRRRPAPIEERLATDCHAGHITLVLGAGISTAAGIPSWPTLVARVWQRCKPRAPWPIGLPHPEPVPETPNPATGPPASAAHPLTLQIALEDLEESLQPTEREVTDPRTTGKAKLANEIRTALYENLADPATGSSLDTLVRVIRRDQKRPRRRIARIISFNADDILEQLANAGFDHHEQPVVWPISRASFHPRRGACANGKPPIPVYHIHGYLPQPGNLARAAPDTLVFTDGQYWDSVASPASFANRVFGNALQETRCVFVGLSMHDINVMRWLSTHAAEVHRDKLAEFTGLGKTPRAARKAAGRALRRHYWIHVPSQPDDGLVLRHLYRRGVFPVGIEDWTKAFQRLMRQCFLI